MQKYLVFYRTVASSLGFFNSASSTYTKGQILKENMQSAERLVIASTLIAELCKFNVCPTTIVLELLRSCVKDFHGANIRISCSIIITCGVFISR